MLFVLATYMPSGPYKMGCNTHSGSWDTAASSVHLAAVAILLSAHSVWSTFILRAGVV